MHRGRLADLQARQVEVGRIRLGTSETKTNQSGREYQKPVKLDRFRLTSRSQQLIEEAAGRYGGEVEPWEPQSGGATQFQVIVEARSLPIIVPPDPLSQFYEVWSGGKVQRRCDGMREILSDQACLCSSANPDPAKRQCKPYTRLSVMLAEMNGVGVWRLETHGYNAAVELPAVVDLLSRAGGNIAARLEMEERSSVVEVNGKEVTSRFMVPVIHVEMTPAAIVGSFTPRLAVENGGPAPAALEQGPSDPTAMGADNEQARQHWTAFTELENKLMAASTRNQMMYLRQEIAQAPLPAEFLQELTEKWNGRAKALASQASPSTSTTDPNTVQTATPATPAPAPTLDRGQVWLAIQTWGGYNSVTTSQLAARFKEWGQGGDDLRQADAATLEQFRLHLAGGS